MLKIFNTFYSDYFLEIKTNCFNDTDTDTFNSNSEKNKINNNKIYIFKIPLYPLYDPCGFYGPYNLQNKFFLPDYAIGICIDGIPFISQECNKINNFKNTQPYINYYNSIPINLNIWGINNLKLKYKELNEIVDENSEPIANINSYLCFCLKNNIHSPLIGFSFDGFPIYGPHGWKENSSISNEYKKVILFRSGYNKNNLFEENLGDLDICNGIFGPTPEYPNGIYHYKTTIELDSNNFPLLKNNNIISSYPHIIARYKGNPEIRNFYYN
jgi:hypothetical protein